MSGEDNDTYRNAEDIRALIIDQAVFREKLYSIESHMEDDKVWKSADARWKRDIVEQKISKIESDIRLINGIHKWTAATFVFLSGVASVLAMFWDKVTKIIT